MDETRSHDEYFMELKYALQMFQQHRLRHTYSDFMDHPQYSGISRFFFEKFYAPQHASRRHAGLRKLHRYLNGTMYKGIISSMEMILELHDHSDALDNLMVQNMIQKGIGLGFSMADYQKIYCELDCNDRRMRQINLTAETVLELHRLSRKWIVGVSLKTVIRAARLLQMNDLADFTQEGYAGFKPIHDIQFLVNAIKNRETAWHNSLWALKDIL